MLNKIATSNKARGKGLNFKKFSGKCWALVYASLLSVSAQATHPEFEDWSFDQDGNFYTSTGRQIKPWDQPKELRQARKLGLDEVQTLLNNSALRIKQCNNGDFVLHLHGRLRGGVRGLPGCYCPLAPNCDNLCQVRRQALSRLRRTGPRSGNPVPNFVPQVVITPAPRRVLNNSLQLQWTGSSNRQPGYRPLTQQERDAHKDQLITNTVTKKLKKNPNTLILFKEKKSSWKKKELEEFNGAWDKKIGQKVKGSRHYRYSRNSKGDMTLKDLRRGIVYPIFAEDRQNTDCYLPRDYPKRTKDYSARDTDLGAWLLKRYTEYKLPLNQALIGGVGKSFKGPFHRVLSEPKHRTTKPMLATFGIVTNKMGPSGFRELSLQLEQSDNALSQLLFEAHQWLGLFKNPNKYFVVNMERPIPVFKGEPLTRKNIPPAIVKCWSTNPHFTKNIQGNLAIQDKRNGLTYTTFVSDRRCSDAFLPMGYDYPDRDTQIGGWLIERYVDHKMELHDVLIGNMEDRIHKIFSEPKHRTNTAILSTFGIVANKMGPGKLYALGKKLRKTNPNSGSALMEAAQWLYMFRKPDQYFSLSLEKPIPGFQGTVLTQVPTEQQFLLGSLYLQATGGKGIKGIGIPPYSDKRVKDFQEGGLQKAFSKKEIDVTNHLKNRSVALTLITGKSLESLWEQTGLNRPLNEPWIPSSPRIKNTPYQNDKDLLFGPMAKNVEETVERLFGFVEDVSPGTAGGLKYLIEFGGSRVEEFKSLGRKLLRAGGVPREYAQDTMDAFEDVVTLGLGGKAIQTVSKLKINPGAKKVAKAKAERVNKAPYDPHKMKELLGSKYGPLTSSTIPEVFQPNVKLAGKRHPTTGIVFDRRGYPIFDNIMVFETRLPKKVSSVKERKSHMKAATKDLRSQIQAGKVDKNQFTKEQLQQINKGEPTIDGHTWHHHQELGRMQLVDEQIHRLTNHVGGMKTWF